MKIFITGASGFLGGSIAAAATSRGHVVTRANRADLAAIDERLGAALPDVIVHAAGSASVAASIRDPAADFEASVITWAKLLDAVRRSGQSPRIVFLSSAAVYGSPERLPITEGAAIAPISPYGFHKAACELVGREHAACFGLDVTVARLFSVIGPSQRRLLVWEIAAQASGPSRDIVLQGTGDETRDYLLDEDVASAILALADRPFAAGRFEALNLASGVEVSIATVARLVRDRVAPHKAIRCLGRPRPGDPPRWRADTTAISSRLPAFAPRPFEEALDRCLGAWTEDP